MWLKVCLLNHVVICIIDLNELNTTNKLHTLSIKVNKVLDMEIQTVRSIKASLWLKGKEKRQNNSVERAFRGK